MNIKIDNIDQENTIGIFYKNIHNLIRDNYLIRLRNEPLPLYKDEIKLTTFIKEKSSQYGMDCLKIEITKNEDIINNELTIRVTKKDIRQNNRVKILTQLAEKIIYCLNEIVGQEKRKDEKHLELVFWFSNSILFHEKIISEENLDFVIDNHNLIFDWKLDRLPALATKNIFNFSSYRNDDYKIFSNNNDGIYKNIKLKNDCKTYGDSIVSITNDGDKIFYIIKGLSNTCVITRG